MKNIPYVSRLLKTITRAASRILVRLAPLASKTQHDAKQLDFLGCLTTTTEPERGELEDRPAARPWCIPMTRPGTRAKNHA